MAALELADRGATVVGVGDYSGGLYDENGLDVAALMDWTAEGSALADYDGRDSRRRTPRCSSCPVTCSCSPRSRISSTAENAPRITARMVAEGANGPTSLEADEMLLERGILVLPDILTNAGGVTVSYFEWVQDIGRFFWDREEIRSRLAEKMATAFDRVWELSEERSLTLRDAALDLRDPRGGCGPGRERPVPVTLVREAMVAEPAALAASASAAEAGDRLAQPDVRAVLVTDDGGRLVGVRYEDDARPRGRRRRARPSRDAAR